jgi:Entner-Doudoroff aldolase
MEAAIRGGFKIIEFTLNTPGALSEIEHFAARSDLVVGAGTVLTPLEVDAAVAAGARFIVSPVVDEAVIERAAHHGVASMPGCSTPTELLRAANAGAELQKLFPAPASGPSFARACLGPLPQLRLVPTSGVDASNAADWFAGGVWAVGFVAPLFDERLMRERDYDAIETRAINLLESCAKPSR